MTHLSRSRLVSTYSIVAYDPKEKQLGVAVQSHYMGVGGAVPWLKAGVGAVATQSLVRISYGPLGLALMEGGKSPQEALDSLLASDDGASHRQVAMANVKGEVATHTGALCIQGAGHRQGKNYSVQANLMEKDTVWDAMSTAFEAAEGDLAERMMVALESAEAEGGDIRGKQSAALKVISAEMPDAVGNESVFNLHVEDHPEPLVELRRLLSLARAYQHANKADDYLLESVDDESKLPLAIQEFETAMNLMPEGSDNPELAYWYAIGLATAGQLDKALHYFEEIFAKDKSWQVLIPRLVDSDLMKTNQATIDKIMAL